MTSPMQVNHGHAYQGYPYTNPIVTEAPSVRPATAGLWSNLPRRQLISDRKTSIPESVVYIDIPDNGRDNNNVSKPNTTNLQTTTTNNIRKVELSDTPVVYIDIPEHQNTPTAQNRENERWRGEVSGNSNPDFGRVEISPITVNQGHPYQGYPYTNTVVTDAPSIKPESARLWSNIPTRHLEPDRRPSIPDTVVYIDIPENGTAGTSNASRPATLNLRPITTNNNDKVDPDDNPVVYIDLPEQQNLPTVHGGNERHRDANVSTNAGASNSSSNNADFVQETIFYDPFKDRRIDVGERHESSTPGSTGTNTGSALAPTQFPYGSQLSSAYPSPSPAGSLPPLIPVTDFPKPPPAYTEVDTRPRPPLPRTEVIVPNNEPAIGIASSDRKLVSCPHCNRLVHTLAVRENACVTHIIAIIFLFLFFPFGVLVYCTDYFKYRNHYCPNCNKLIGYEIPMFCQGLTYTKPL